MTSLPPAVPARPLSELLAELADELSRRYEDPTAADPTGVADLDRLLGRTVRASALLIASAPGVGRTTLALQIALREAWSGGLPVFAANTLRAAEVAQRVLAMEGEIRSSDVRDGRLGAREWARIARSVERTDREMVIADGIDTLDDLRGLVDHVRASRGEPSLVVVDCVGPMLGAATAHEFGPLISYVDRQPFPWVFTMRLVATAAVGRFARDAELLDTIPDRVAGTMIVLEPRIFPLVHARVVRNRSGATGVVDLMLGRGYPRFYGVAREP